jgi:hypothetical protein
MVYELILGKTRFDMESTSERPIEEMKTNQQRIAIAEACGWTRCREAVLGSGATERNPSPYGYPPGKSYEVSLPDYLHDLNAMHKAENVLSATQEENYVNRLGSILMSAGYEGDERWQKSELSSWDSTYRATAAQRAEAFLRTLNLWKS